MAAGRFFRRQIHIVSTLQEKTMHRLINLLFDNEEGGRGLLINYVTLQLLSDAGFCLDRWVIKGGGKPRKQNHQKHLEQWLWRALWDIYIASDLNTNRRLRYVRAKVNQGCDSRTIHGPAMVHTAASPSRYT